MKSTTVTNCSFEPNSRPLPACLALLFLTHKPGREANGPHAPLIIEVDKHMLLHDKLHHSHHMLTPDKHPAINDHIC